jgi:sirohydrochlorin cobaltochelatase
MKTIIVLAVHGSPPKDFPRRELAEFFGLHGRLENAAGKAQEQLQQRHDVLEARMRAWPRTVENDPFYAASHEIARKLAHALGPEVLVGFNEFCAPSLDEALDLAAQEGAERIVVTTPMMTQGGGHAEQDIPVALDRARERHPKIDFRYAWPFDPADVAEFLAKELVRHLQESMAPGSNIVESGPLH